MSVMRVSVDSCAHLSQDATSFTVVQMMFATLVLAAFVALLVFWQRLVEFAGRFGERAEWH